MNRKIAYNSNLVICKKGNIINNKRKDLYNKISNRFWEKLEYNKNKFKNLNCVDWGKPFPIDQFNNMNPEVKDLIKEVEDEYGCKMTEFQCSWAICQFLKGGIEMMKKFNKHNKTNLIPRK